MAPKKVQPPERRNGYIIRIKTKDGKRIYRPEWIGYLTPWHHLYIDEGKCNKHWHSWYWQRAGAVDPVNSNRRISLQSDYWSDLRCHKPMPNIQEEAKLGRSPRRPSHLIKLVDDPVLEGRELAKSGLRLPGDPSAHRANKEVPRLAAQADGWVSEGTKFCTEDEKDIAELHRMRLLYDDDNEKTNGTDFHLGDITHEEPTYVIRHVARRKGKKGPSPRKLVVAEGEQLAFVPDELWDQISNLSELDAYHLIVDDDLLSIPESWIELESEYLDST